MKEKIKSLFLTIYLIVLIILGILFVPCYSVFGSKSEYNIESLSYVPFWKLINKKLVVNGFTLRYDLCLSRLLYQLFIATLIIYILYLLVSNILDIKTHTK